MKTLEQLGISPAPWTKAGDIVDDNEGRVIFNAYEDDDYANARLIAASPELYENAYKVADNLRVHLAVPTQSITMNRAEVEAMAKELEYALALAAGEMDAVLKHLEKYKGTKEPDYCCADCIEDIAKEVGFSFASGDGGAEWTV